MLLVVATAPVSLSCSQFFDTDESAESVALDTASATLASTPLNPITPNEQLVHETRDHRHQESTVECSGLWTTVSTAAGTAPSSLREWESQLRDVWLADWNTRLDDLGYSLDRMRAADQVREASSEALTALAAMRDAQTVSAAARQAAAHEYRDAHLQYLATEAVYRAVGGSRDRRAELERDRLLFEALNDMPSGLGDELQALVWTHLDQASGSLRTELLAAEALANAAGERRIRDANLALGYGYPPDWAPAESSEIRRLADSDASVAALEALLYPYRDTAVSPFREAYRAIEAARAAATQIAATALVLCL